LVYPSENKKLADEIVRSGAIVSEFPLGFPPVQSNFAARNRIISGLCLGVLVTEAAVDSGSMITAGCAADQGREVFAVPGPITVKTAEGVNKLIKEGVHPVTEAADILEVLDIERRALQLETGNWKPQTSKLDKTQQSIIKVLDGQSKHIDSIMRESGLSISEVSAALSLMELSGFVKNYGSGIWGV
jgi:DNA processing protein